MNYLFSLSLIFFLISCSNQADSQVKQIKQSNAKIETIEERSYLVTDLSQVKNLFIFDKYQLQNSG